MTVSIAPNVERPWLQLAHYTSEYLAPRYYEEILRPYVFSGRSDLDVLRTFCDRAPSTEPVLELGCGSGRASAVLLNQYPFAAFTGIDLSARMLNHCRTRFRTASMRTRWKKGDTLSYISTTDSEYGSIVSLWSLSHAVHQSIARTGVEETAKSAIASLFHRLVKPNGRVLIIHFDATSDEQQISLRQRARKWRFLQPGVASPSEVLLEKQFECLDRTSEWELSIRRLDGDSIVYPTMDRALETFMNLHMEGWFNQAPERDEVLRALEYDLAEHMTADGQVRIAPRCILFEAHRKR